MKRKSKITNILKNNFKIYDLKVMDVSRSHQGHSGFLEGEETHFEIIVVTDDFKYKTKLERHRLLNNLLKEEFNTTLHSVSYELLTISESKTN